MTEIRTKKLFTAWLTPAERVALEELANSQTAGDRTALIRKFIQDAIKSSKTEKEEYDGKGDN